MYSRRFGQLTVSRSSFSFSCSIALADDLLFYRHSLRTSYTPPRYLPFDGNLPFHESVYFSPFSTVLSYSNLVLVRATAGMAFFIEEGNPVSCRRYPSRLSRFDLRSKTSRLTLNALPLLGSYRYCRSRYLPSLYRLLSWRGSRS